MTQKRKVDCDFMSTDSWNNFCDLFPKCLIPHPEESSVITNDIQGLSSYRPSNSKSVKALTRVLLGSVNSPSHFFFFLMYVKFLFIDNVPWLNQSCYIFRNLPWLFFLLLLQAFFVLLCYLYREKVKINVH